MRRKPRSMNWGGTWQPSTFSASQSPPTWKRRGERLHDSANGTIMQKVIIEWNAIMTTPDRQFERHLPIKMVIPDASPLITLALASLGDPSMAAEIAKEPLGHTYLDLLKVFGVQLQLVDQVEFEVTRQDKPDARLIVRWLEKNRGERLPDGRVLIDTAETDIGRWVQRDIANGRKPGRDKGEDAINEFLRDFDDYRVSEDEVDLVLYEDAPAKAMLDRRPNVHLLTTLEFLEKMEAYGLVNVIQILDAIRASDPDQKIRQDTKLLRDIDNAFDGPTAATVPDTSWEEGVKPWPFR